MEYKQKELHYINVVLNIYEIILLFRFALFTSVFYKEVKFIHITDTS